ncbi:MAG: HAMP domain-containing sensor histidine kinase [Planctomycetota bacterium]
MPALPTIAISAALGLLLGVAAAVAATRARARRQSAKAALAERRARAAERLAEIGSMTSGLAHEIKNPLSTIGMNAQLLAEGLDELGTEDERIGRLSRRVGALTRETERLRGILTDFLDYAGEKTVVPAPVDLGELAEQLTDFIHPQAERQGVRIRLQRDHTAELTANADAGLIKQALLNLALNALQAMESPDPQAAQQAAPQPGPRPASPRELMLRVEPGDEAGEPVVVLRVADTGPGMDDETRRQIFSPYFTTKAGGTGLGLPTTRRIVEAHGGTIEVFSHPGRGTEFDIRLPVNGPAEGPDAPGERR